MSEDFTFINHGSIWLVRPATPELREHLEANVSDQAQWFGGALVVEPRYVDTLADALQGEGYVVGEG
jgi:hypothetical protein